MKSKYTLRENLSAIVYRLMSSNEAIDILKANTLKLNATLHWSTEFKFTRGKLFYKSFSRTLHNRYFENELFESDRYIQVIMKFDGNKLNQKVKSIPVAYYKSKALGSEAEDRIISNRPIIKNIIPTIKFAYIILSKNYWKEKNYKSLATINAKLQLLIKLLEQNNIEYKIYLNKLTRPLSDEEQKELNKLLSTVPNKNIPTNISPKDIPYITHEDIEDVDELILLLEDVEKFVESLLKRRVWLRRMQFNHYIQSYMYASRLYAGRVKNDEQLQKLVKLLLKNKVKNKQDFINLVTRKLENALKYYEKKTGQE